MPRAWWCAGVFVGLALVRERKQAGRTHATHGRRAQNVVVCLSFSWLSCASWPYTRCLSPPAAAWLCRRCCRTGGCGRKYVGAWQELSPKNKCRALSEICVWCCVVVHPRHFHATKHASRGARRRDRPAVWMPKRGPARLSPHARMDSLSVWLLALFVCYLTLFLKYDDLDFCMSPPHLHTFSLFFQQERALLAWVW